MIMVELVNPWQCPACNTRHGYFPVHSPSVAECSCCHRIYYRLGKSTKFQDCKDGTPLYWVFINEEKVT